MSRKHSNSTPAKRFIARVSTPEQQQEGFSLDVQEKAMWEYAARQGGEIVQRCKVAGAATDRREGRGTLTCYLCGRQRS